ncbi:MAG: PocR ligand-binding domain-containing protein [Pirellulales bacterium]|nr:PocR ligand-binding domain-containing protein [Pirellulales bacterium]
MNHKIQDVINVDGIRALLESFSQALGIATAIIDLDGTILVASGWRDICTKFHRVCPKTAKRCLASDTVLACQLAKGEKYNIYQCQNGLVDIAVPIVVRGEHLGNLFTGQLLLEAPDRESFRRQAAKYGFDEDAYLDALSRVPVIPESEIKPIVAFLLQLTSLLAEMGLSRIAQHETTEALRRSEEQFALFMDASPAIAWMEDDRGRYVYVNDTWKKTFDFEQDDWLGKAACDLAATGIVENIRDDDQKILATGKPVESLVETREEASTETRYWHSIRFPMESPDGEHFVGGWAVDVTQQKRAEESVRLSAAEWQATFDAIKDAVFLCNVDGDLLRCNRSAAELLGKSPEEVIGQKCYELVHRTTERIENCPVERMLRTRQSEESILPVGEKWFAVTADPLLDENGTLYGAVHSMRDVTARKRAEHERETLIVELEKKNAEMERFNYTISHDLKSPLITIKGFMGLLEEDLSEGNMTGARERMAHIDNAANRMHELLSDLLRLSRIGRVVEPSEDVALEELAGEAVKLVAGRLLNGAIRVDVSPELPHVYGDRGRLLDVLQNLIENATKYMGDQPDPLIEVGARRDQEQTVVYVRDNGMGIEPRYHDKVFTLFGKLTSGGEGTGVGLALVKRIIELHGGRIWIESEGSGRGSTFCFVLPPKEEAINDDKSEGQRQTVGDTPR